MLVIEQGRGLLAYNARASEILNLNSEVHYQFFDESEGWYSFQIDGTPLPQEHYPFVMTMHTGKAYRDVRMGVRRPDGKRLWLTVNSQMITLENKPYVLCTFWDESEKTEKDLLDQYQQNLFSNAIIHNTTLGIAFVSPEGHWLEVNHALCLMLGYSREELLELTFQDITFIEDLDLDLSYVEQMLAGDMSNYQLEKRYVHKDGSIIWALLSVNLIRNDDQSPKFFVSRVVNISEQKKLMRTLEDQNQVLNESRRELQKKLSQLLEFNQMLAHHLRGPASSIKQITELLDIVEQPEQQEFLPMLDSLANDLLNTLNDLQATIHLQTFPEKQIVDCYFKDILTKAKETLSPQIQARNVQIIEELKVANVRVSNHYLEEIVVQLMDNAIKFSRPGVPPVITIRTYKNKEGKVVLTLEDNGLGMDLAQYGNQVFRYKKRFHGNFEGSGIGLFKVKNQIEAMGGTIQLQSKVGQGSLFIISMYDLLV